MDGNGEHSQCRKQKELMPSLHLCAFASLC
jgi:hypothetical protein